MERTNSQTQSQSDRLRRFREQADADNQGPVDIRLKVDGSLKVSDDENRGGDPYNHTGSNTGKFKRPTR